MHKKEKRSAGKEPNDHIIRGTTQSKQHISSDGDSIDI